LLLCIRYDPRLRPPGKNSSAALRDVFCDRSKPLFHWGRCEQARNSPQLGEEHHNLATTCSDEATLVSVNLFVRDFTAISDVRMVGL
jgi:hypothetical protein